MERFNTTNARHTGLRTVVIGAAVAGLLFAGLMAVRLDLFKPAPVPVANPQPDASAKETWMTIWQSDRKIGYSHRQLAEAETGYRLADRTVMRVNTMGLVQDIDLEIAADLNPDLSLSTFKATLASSRFSFSVQGRVAENNLHVSTESGQFKFPLAAPPYLTAGIWDIAAAAPLTPGESADIPVFDPISMGNHTVRATFEGRETIHIPPAGEQTARKFTVSFMGASETAWIDDQGAVLKEEGLLGITLVKDTRENALDTRTLSGSRDLALAAAIPSGTILEAPASLARLELKVGGLPPNLLLEGGRQSFSEGILTIVREDLPDPPDLPPDEAVDFLAAGPFIQSDHPEIIKAAGGAVMSAHRPLSKAKRLVKWVHDTIEKRPVLSVPTALETLRQGAGDCNEHAVLLAALARAAGIPARVEAGLVYMDGRFYYHAWNSLYLGRWITADALMNQLPADVTHIRLVRGAAADQADILGAIGQITIQIMSRSP
jgi:hypothetical protein